MLQFLMHTEQILANASAHAGFGCLYMNPIFWSVYGLIISQVDNLDTACSLIRGEAVPVYEAVLIIIGYQ